MYPTKSTIKNYSWEESSHFLLHGNPTFSSSSVLKWHALSPAGATGPMFTSFSIVITQFRSCTDHLYKRLQYGFTICGFCTFCVCAKHEYKFLKYGFTIGKCKTLTHSIMSIHATLLDSTADEPDLFILIKVPQLSTVQHSTPTCPNSHGLSLFATSESAIRLIAQNQFQSAVAFLPLSLPSATSCSPVYCLVLILSSIPESVLAYFVVSIFVHDIKIQDLILVRTEFLLSDFYST